MKYLIPLILSIFVIQCSNENNSKIKYNTGDVSNGGYSNDFFGFSIRYDSNWHVFNEREKLNLHEQGNYLLWEENVNNNSNKLKTDYLLSIQKNGIDKSKFAPSLIITSNRPQNIANISNGAMYLHLMKRALGQSYLCFKFDTPIYEKKIDGYSFGVLEYEYCNTPQYVFQENYCVIVGGRSLCIILTYSSDLERVELHSFLTSIKMNI